MNYPVENGERRLLSNVAYSEYVAENTVLAKAQTKAYAYLVAGYSHGDAGEVLGRSRGTVSTHAQRIKNNLAEAQATVEVLREPY